MSVAEELAPEISWPRRLISIAVAFLVIAGGAYAVYYFAFSGSSSSAVVAKPQEVTVTRGALVSSLTTTGTAAATLTSKLMFQGSGQVKSISVGIGDHVTAGQELARLDDTTAQRQLQTAAANLNSAKLKLQQLTDPPKASDIAAAQQSIASAKGQLATAQSNLAKLLNPPSTDIDAADTAVLQAQNGLASANNSLNTSWANLLNAQRNYCNTLIPMLDPPQPCQTTDLPLSTNLIATLTNLSGDLGGKPSDVSAALTVTNAFLSANANYVSAQGSLALAQKNLDAAVAKRKALTDPPDPLQLAQLQASVDSATAALAGAQARYDTLMAGPASTDLALAQQSVDLAQVSYQQALDSANGLVLTAPFDGIVGAIPINVGDQVGATTAAMTLTNPDRVRIDLTVTETDFSGLKAGEYGIATFDSLPGQTFLVKITGVSSTPTVAQGVVTYPVQALILRGQDLAASAADLQKVASALASLSGGGLGGFAGGQRGQAANGTPGAQRTPGANGQRTPQAGVTPGQGGFAGGQNGQAGGGGFGAAQAFGNGPLPVTGMTANVIVLLDVKENALLVPNAAVKRQGRTSYVLVPQADGTTRQQTVGVGGSDNTNTEITTGLNEGDKVLVGVTSTTPTAGRTTTTFEGGFGPGGRGPTPAGGVR